MPNETQRVASTSKSDRDSALREQLFRAALAGTSPSDPFAHIPMSAISERLGEAESSLLYQFDTSDGSDALTAFRAAAYVRTVERFRASVGTVTQSCAVESLARGDTVPGLGREVRAAWSEFAPGVHDLVAFVAAARGLSLLLGHRGWTQGNLVANLDFEATGRRLLATVSETDFMRRIISVSCGFGVTPYEQSWKSVAGDSVCVATYCTWLSPAS